MGKAMQAIAVNPADTAAEAVLNGDRSFHSMLRTTCVATLLDGGHANNALPQRAGANVNCRIFPGHSIEEVQRELQDLIADTGVTITPVPPLRPQAKTPPLDPAIIGPMEKLAAKYFPGVPVVPTMSTGGTDAVYLATVGIPTYGVPGVWANPDFNGVHGHPGINNQPHPHAENFVEEHPTGIGDYLLQGLSTFHPVSDKGWQICKPLSIHFDYCFSAFAGLTKNILPERTPRPCRS